MHKDSILDIEHLTVRFPDKTVLDDINLSIQRGTMVSLIGENGAGKTTLIRTILHQLKPTKGKIIAHPGAGRRHLEIGYVPQFRNIDTGYPLSIKSFVGLNRLKHRWPFYLPQEHAALISALKRTNLLKLQNIRLGSASGGEKQRAYLAQALVNDPELLILDEATASLDVKAKNELMTLVQQLNQSDQLTVIFITHDFELAQKYTQRFMFLNEGKIETGPVADLSEKFLEAHA
ncbi:ABC transporter family protein [Agrilactobacillus composti DSM 18527 = JCM 14202]|uniref:ABC transporter family protein n=1 Tax=Agrilactobacillus composti DSM 18527 = JCM 14202 TaxID=1423734 RepID=X0PPH0_9LACO|nr:ATP-binding cassette domain-containing protein [Agrilactobacillus composti]KRM31086.1 ABC transporter family protein [Agrilactobacillus composti DSM 18527 = JCM 14202]GAF39532.1 zinc ABC transporter, ATP-binding protein ZnuC [Agrilactobacillus composti DSM 18527 = JCM 14202]